VVHVSLPDEGDQHIDVGQDGLRRTMSLVRASERQRVSGQQLRTQFTVWPGNAITITRRRVRVVPFPT